MFEYNTDDEECIECHAEGMVLDDNQLCVWCSDDDEGPDEDMQYTIWIDNIRNPDKEFNNA